MSKFVQLHMAPHHHPKDLNSQKQAHLCFNGNSKLDTVDLYPSSAAVIIQSLFIIIYIYLLIIKSHCHTGDALKRTGSSQDVSIEV